MNIFIKYFSPKKINGDMKSGFGLIEVMVGAAIITIAILALLASYSVYISYAYSNQDNVRAGSLLEEGVEVVKILRDNGWTSNIATLSTGTTYYLSWSGSAWTATATAQPYVDSIFNRTFTVASVSRDNTTGDIVTTGGTVDSGTKLVTVSVAYKAGHSTSTQSISTYITNLQSN